MPQEIKPPVNFCYARAAMTILNKTKITPAAVTAGSRGEKIMYELSGFVDNYPYCKEYACEFIDGSLCVFVYSLGEWGWMPPTQEDLAKHARSKWMHM